MVKHPLVIKVGACDVDVKSMEDKEAMSHGIHGHYSSCESVIRINKTLPKNKFAEVLLHEVLHAAYDVGHLEDCDDEEKTVSVLSTVFAQIIRDNPDFVNFLKRCLK